MCLVSSVHLVFCPLPLGELSSVGPTSLSRRCGSCFLMWWLTMIQDLPLHQRKHPTYLALHNSPCKATVYPLSAFEFGILLILSHVCLVCLALLPNSHLHPHPPSHQNTEGWGTKSKQAIILREVDSRMIPISIMDVILRWSCLMATIASAVLSV